MNAPETVEKKEHSVENGVVKRTSVSAIQSFVECNRKWFYTYVEHLDRGPPSRGQERGKQGHARIEEYLKGGPNVLDPLERLGLDLGLIPVPGPGILVEPPFAGKPEAPLIALKAEGVPLAGFVDLVNLREPGKIKVVDWKFKSSIDDYGIRKKDIFDPKTDAGIQLIGYAEWARQNFPGRTIIEAGHVTFQTKGPRRVEPVFDTRRVDEMPGLWDAVSKPVIPAMKQVAQAKNAMEVRGAKMEVCRKYGGCAFLKKCFPDPMQRLADSFKPVEGALGGNMAGFLKFGAPTTSPAAAPAPAPAPAAAPIAQTGTPVAPAKVAPTAAGNRLSLPNTDPPLGIVPPDSPRRASKIIIEGATGPVLPVSTPAAAPVATVAAVLPAGPSADGGPVAATAAPGGDSIAPKRRGRPLGSKNAPAAALDPTPVIALPDPVPPPAPPVTAQAPAAANPVPAVPEVGGGAVSSQDGAVSPPEPTRGGVRTPGVHRVCINCMPTKGPTLDLLPYVLLLEKRILEGLQMNMPIPDLRLCNDQVLGFGRWKSVLEAAVELKDLAAGTYVVTTRDERVLIVADTLSRLLPDGAVTRGCL